MTPNWSDALRALGACDDAVEWASTQPDAATAWRDCERADWMLWLAGRLAGPTTPEARGALVLAACACARTALRYVPEGEGRPRRAIETAEAWARGEGSIDDVRAAAAAADAAADAADADSAAFYAANAALYADEIGRAHV